MPQSASLPNVRLPSRLILTGIALASLCMIAMGGLALCAMRLMEERAQLMQRTQSLMLVSERMVSELRDALANERGYVITGSPLLLHAFYSSVGTARQTLNRLSVRALQEPEQRGRIDSLRSRTDRLLIGLETLVGARREMTADSMIRSLERLFLANQATMDELRVELATLVAQASHHLHEQADQLRRSLERLRFLLSGLTGGLIVLGVTALLLARGWLRRRKMFESEIRRGTQDLAASNKELKTANDAYATALKALEQTHIQLEAMTERERRSSRRLFETVAETQPAAFIIYGPGLRYEYMNHTALAVLGVEMKDVQGHTHYDLFGPGIDPAYLQALRKAEETRLPQETEFSFEIHGQTLTMRSKIVPLMDDQGVMEHLLVFNYDISAERERERQLRESLRDKEVLLAEIHHRVKNNLAVVSGLLNLQAGMTNDPETQQALEESRSRIESMALIHEKLYRGESLARLDFCEYITDLARHISETSQRPNLEVEVKVSCNRWRIDVDTALPCGLIINELLSNAFKHAFEGRSKGEINIRLLIPDGSAQLVVEDNGVGLPETGPEPTRLSGNRSLGLRLVRGLCRQIRANLRVESTPGQGTRYEIIFTRPQPEEPGKPPLG